MKLLLTASLFVLLVGAARSEAQIVNGDFAQGSTGWTVTGDAKDFTITFQTEGQDGYVSVQHLVSIKEAVCLQQTVECAPEGENVACPITVDYKVPGAPENPIIVSIKVDGGEIATATHAFETPLKTLAGSVAKGSHQIEICFESESAATLRIESVRLGTGAVPTVPSTWGGIKARYL